MDSYGIKEAQMAGHSQSDYVQQYNDHVKEHNHLATNAYLNTKSQLAGSQASATDRSIGMDAYHSLGAIHTGFEHVAMLRKYGGYKNALVQGTAHNIYNLSGGKLGQVPIGPKEMGVRNQLQATIKSSPAGRLTTNQRYTGTADIEAARTQDSAAGFKLYGKSTDSLETIGKETTQDLTSEGMSLEGKVAKKLSGAIGLGEAASHSVGQLAGGIEAGVGGVATAIEDFSSGAKKFKSENTNQKFGDVTGMVGSAVGVAATFVPILAPVAAVLSGVSAIEDFIGGHEADTKTNQSAATNYKSNLMTQKSQPIRQMGSTATDTGRTSLQKVSGTNSSF